MATTSTTTIADRYELAERIGGGGGGAVWRGHDTAMDRTVAVKLVPLGGDLTERERERVRTRVAREARATARLRHPAIPTVFDTVIEDTQVAIVMTHVDAPNLRQRVSDDGVLDDEQAADLGRQMVDVLAAAHDAGIIHRDVKPSNVLVDDEGEAKLTDFGIARVGDETRLTRTGHTIGSPSYLAPEQARGEDPTPAADLWGLGATLYFAITGVSPFDRGGALPSMHAVLHVDPAEPERDSVLWPLIRWLLSKHPDRRPDVDQVREYLRDPAEGAAAAADRRTETVPLPDEENGGSAGAAGAAGAGGGAGGPGTQAWGRDGDQQAAEPAATWSGRRGIVAILLALLATSALVVWSATGVEDPSVDGTVDGTVGGPVDEVTDIGDTDQHLEEEPAPDGDDQQQEPTTDGNDQPGNQDPGPNRDEPPPGQEQDPGRGGGPPGQEDGAPGHADDPGNRTGNANGPT